MHIDILTLFPEMFPGYLNESILKRAQEMGQLSVGLHNIRDYAAGKHRVTDEPPFGGGGGMVLKPEPIFAAAEAVLAGEQGSGGAEEKDFPRSSAPPPPCSLAKSRSLC